MFKICEFCKSQFTPLQNFPQHKNRFCSKMCYWKSRKGPRTKCTIGDCNSASRGYQPFCDKHYRRYSTYGDPLFSACDHEHPICKIPKCGHKTLAKSLCNKHYLKLSIYGDPLTSKNRPKGTGTIHTQNGYTTILIKIGKRRQAISRFIAEKHLNRLLKNDEIVHHIDKNPMNNFPSNLVVCKRNDHIRFHKLKHSRNSLPKGAISLSPGI